MNVNVRTYNVRLESESGYEAAGRDYAYEGSDYDRVNTGKLKYLE